MAVTFGKTRISESISNDFKDLGFWNESITCQWVCHFVFSKLTTDMEHHCSVCPYVKEENINLLELGNPINNSWLVKCVVPMEDLEGDRTWHHELPCYHLHLTHGTMAATGMERDNNQRYYVGDKLLSFPHILFNSCMSVVTNCTW